MSFAPIRDMQAEIYRIAAGLSLVLALVTWLVIRRMVRPLGAAAAQIRAFAQVLSASSGWSLTLTLSIAAAVVVVQERMLPPRLSAALVHKFPSILEYKSPTFLEMPEQVVCRWLWQVSSRSTSVP